MNRDDATFEELYALGVPMTLLARRFATSRTALYDRAHYIHVKRPPRKQQAVVARDLRLARIRANIQASPSVSMWPMEKAA